MDDLTNQRAREFFEVVIKRQLILHEYPHETFYYYITSFGDALLFITWSDTDLDGTPKHYRH